MSDPSALGNAAIAALVGILVAVFGGLGVFQIAFRTSKNRLYERIGAIDKQLGGLEEQIAKRIGPVEQRLLEHLDKAEQQLGNRIALQDTRHNDTIGTMSDRMHDLEEKGHAAAVQLATQSTTQANIAAMLGRLEGMINTAQTFKEHTTSNTKDMLAQILAAVKAGKT